MKATLRCKYEDGAPGEIFIKMAKEGSTLSGIMDAFALSVSIALQYGVPLRALVDKFVNSRFEPSGYTGNPNIRYAKSVVDYIGRWLGGEIHLARLSRHRRHWRRRSSGQHGCGDGARGRSSNRHKACRPRRLHARTRHD